jgi:hypothetical protein
VLREFGFSAPQIDALLAQGVVQDAAATAGR